MFVIFSFWRIQNIPIFVVFIFQPCDDCNKMKATHIEWRLLPQHKKRLHFKSVSPADSGRYLCTVNDNTIASYQLKVSRTQNLNQEYKFIGRAPEIVDIEKNDDIRPNGIVAVKCKIISPIAPRIWWLKQCEEAQKCDLNYDGKFYYKINVTYDMQREENVYVSKLHLRNFTHRDDGLYVCVTMTELGKDYRTFTLTLPPSVPDDEGERQTSNLSYLFLVPIAFILIPICIDCLGKRIGIKKSKQEVMLLEVVTPTTPRIYNS